MGGKLGWGVGVGVAGGGVGGYGGGAKSLQTQREQATDRQINREYRIRNCYSVCPCL